VVWRSGSAMVSINEVDLRRARLLLGWVTVSGFNSRCRTFISVCNQPSKSTQSSHPLVGTRRAVTSCGSGIKAGMVRVRMASETVSSPCYTWAISECFRDRHNKVLYEFTFFILRARVAGEKTFNFTSSSLCLSLTFKYVNSAFY